MWNGRQGVDVGAGPHPRCLDHPAAGPARHLGAEGRSLLPVELHNREPRRIGQLADLLQGRVDEHADDLGGATDGGGKLDRAVGYDRARRLRPQDHADRPGAERHRELGVLRRG